MQGRYGFTVREWDGWFVECAVYGELFGLLSVSIGPRCVDVILRGWRLPGEWSAGFSARAGCIDRVITKYNGGYLPCVVM